MEESRSMVVVVVGFCGVATGEEELESQRRLIEVMTPVMGEKVRLPGTGMACVGRMRRALVKVMEAGSADAGEVMLVNRFGSREEMLYRELWDGRGRGWSSLEMVREGMKSTVVLSLASK